MVDERSDHPVQPGTCIHWHRHSVELYVGFRLDDAWGHTIVTSVSVNVLEMFPSYEVGWRKESFNDNILSWRRYANGSVLEPEGG